MIPPRTGILLCLLLTIVIVVQTGGAAVQDYQCIHHDPPELARVHLKPGLAEKRAVTDDTFNQAFRVSVVYDSTFTTGLSADIRTRIQVVISNLTEFFQTTLAVRRTPGPILLDRDCTGGLFYVGSTDVRQCVQECESTTSCGPATIPSDHLLRCVQCSGSPSTCTTSGTDGAGVSNTDFILYVSSVTTGCSGSTIAYAGSCQMEDEFDRPIAGFINFCSSGIDADSDDNFIFTVAKHEILHAMVFSTSLFPFFRDENGNPRTTRDANGFPPRVNGAYSSVNTTQTVTYNNWATRTGTTSLEVTLIITPKVVEVGRTHFNCSTLTGVQLENQGGSGTALSHWEKRLLENEAMTGIISSNNAVFSNFTFALLEDSGWYKVNYSAAKQLVWGRGDGCGYTEGSCGGYISSRQQQGESIAPFCNYHQSTITRYGCTIDRTAVSFCNLASYSSALPSQYQYFTSGANFDSSTVTLANIGGRTQIADYCPYQSAFSNGICTDTSNTKTGINNNRGETYGPNSRCVEHTVRWTATGGGFISRTQDIQSGCYEYSCSNSKVTIKVQGQSYTCNNAGQVITIDQTTNGVRYTGTLLCPSCTEICYDDFENCPEAAILYGAISNTQSSTGSNSVAMTTSSTTQVVTETSSSTQVVMATSSSTQVVTATSSSTQVVMATSSSTQVVTATSSSTQVVTATSSSTQIVMTTSSTTQVVMATSSTTRVVTATSSTTQVVMGTNSPATQVVMGTDSNTQVVTATGSTTRIGIATTSTTQDIIATTSTMRVVMATNTQSTSTAGGTNPTGVPGQNSSGHSIISTSTSIILGIIMIIVITLFQ